MITFHSFDIGAINREPYTGHSFDRFLLTEQFHERNFDKKILILWTWEISIDGTKLIVVIIIDTVFDK